MYLKTQRVKYFCDIFGVSIQNILLRRKGKDRSSVSLLLDGVRDSTHGCTPALGLSVVPQLLSKCGFSALFSEPGEQSKIHDPKCTLTRFSQPFAPHGSYVAISISLDSPLSAKGLLNLFI